MQRSGTADTPPKVRASHIETTGTGDDLQALARRASGVSLRKLAVALALIIVALVFVPFAYASAHNGRVFRGAMFLGTSLGGLTRTEAVVSIEKAAAGYTPGDLTVSAGGRSWTFHPADLGLAVDAERVADAAIALGRTEGFPGSTGAQARALVGGTSVPVALKFDAARVDAAVSSIAAEVDRPAVDSRLQVAQGGSIAITPSSAGRVVDRDATRADIVAALASSPFAGVNLVLKDNNPRITEAALKSGEEQAVLLTSQPVLLKSGEQSWTIEPETLRGMLDVKVEAEQTTVSLNADALTGYLQPVAVAVQVVPRDATVAVGKDSVTLRDDVPGADLDVPAAVTAIQQAAQAADASARVVELPLKEVLAAVHTDQLRPLFDRANALVTQGVRLRFRDDGYILRAGSVAGFLDVAKAGDTGQYELTIDEEVLRNRVAGVAYFINRPTADARFRMVGGAPKKVASAREGYKVDVAASVQTAVQAIKAYQGGDRLQIDLNVNVTAPVVTDADLSTVNTPDLLGSGQTSYAGSSPERAWNVGLGTRNIDGALIPPGGVFSTVDAIGDLTLDAGFKMGYAIVNTSAGLKTVPAEAGGICQVATTLFHSVFWSGLPVVERNWHSYWIGLYGVKPSGLQGLDATIAPPEKDFRFKNTTGHWLHIKATADGKTVTFQLYGVNPGWKVAVSGPVITNPVKTNTDPIYDNSDQLPVGRKVLVEHAQDGFDAQITRVVTDGSGNVIDRWVAKSHYQPAHNRYLVGTKKP